MGMTGGFAALAAGLLAFGGSPAAAAEVGPFSGVWQITGYTGVLRTVEGAEPPLRPEAAATYRRNLASFRKNDFSYDPMMKSCASPGTPRLMLLPVPIEIIDRPRQITFLSAWNRLFRIVPVGKPLVEVGYATALGTSVAAREGDALKIHSDQFNTSFLLDAAGLPHSDALVVDETYRLAGNRLRLRVRFEDPTTFTRPWETEVTYRKLPEYRISEDICLDRIAKGQPAIVAADGTN